MKIYLYIIAAFFSTVAMSMEDDHKDQHIHGSHDECELPKSTLDIVNCSVKRHPEVKKELLNVEIEKKRLEKSSQIPNPTLSGRYVKGDDQGEDISELEANLAFTVELGGKRGARKDRARAYQELANSDLKFTKSKVKIMTIENLYRLRQVLEEKEILSKSVKAFNKVIGSLKKRSRLSVEQSASLVLFEMALEETMVEIAEIYEEEREIEHFFHITTGHSIKEIQVFLPVTYKKWPSFKDEIDSKASSENIKRLSAFNKIAKKEFEIESSRAWPDLKIGPSVAIEKEGGKENTLYGVNLSFDLPLFQANGGAKSFNKSKLYKSQRVVELTRVEEIHERSEKLKVYKNNVRILMSSMKKEKITKKQREIEKYYLRGVVSSSVYLESLSQKITLIKKRNEREMTAIKAMWSILEFDGKVLEERI